MPRDFSPMLPASVLVQFTGRPVTVTIAQAAAADGAAGAAASYLGATGHPGQKLYNDTIAYANTPAGPGPPPVPASDNGGDLDKLALLLARAYYAWRVVDAEVVYNGTLDPLVDAHADAVEWTYGPKWPGGHPDANTRRFMQVRNVEPEELSHWQKDNCDTSAPFQVLGPPTTRDKLNNIIFTRYAVSVVAGELVSCVAGTTSIPLC